MKASDLGIKVIDQNSDDYKAGFAAGVAQERKAAVARSQAAINRLNDMSEMQERVANSPSLMEQVGLEDDDDTN